MISEFKPKVTIVIPIYNGSRYMKEAIDSALSQTYSNIEILVINDGSLDDTEKIAKSYGDSIKYIKKTNGGVSTALNLALKNMNGEYFAWLNHDDKYYPNKIEKQIEYLSTLDNRENVILYSDYDLIDKNSSVYAKCIKNHDELTEKSEYGILRNAIRSITLLIPKKAFDECGNFNEDLKYTPDYDLWQKMSKKYKFIHQEEILAMSRTHKEQVTNISPKVIEEFELLWKNLIDSVSVEKMIELEKTEYNFYYEMEKFLHDTPYSSVLKYLNSTMKKMEEKMRKNLLETKHIKVSIVIPFYNRVEAAINAVNSVLNQTYNNYEIILINDASTDDITRLTAFINDNDKIKLINVDKNQGPSNARNIGMEQSTGEYLAFLDSDDLFVNNKIEIQLALMELTQHLFSHTSYTRKLNDSETVMHAGRLSGIVIPSIVNSCVISTPTLMIKRELYSSPNFKYDTSLKIGEDVCLYLSALKNVKVLGIDRPLSIVNADENSTAYNYHKQIEGLKNIMKFVINDPDLTKYDLELATLAGVYQRMVFKHVGYYEDEFYSDHLIFPGPFKRTKKFIYLYKHDRPELRRKVIHRLKPYPTLFKVVRFFVRKIKKVKRFFFRNK